MENAAKALVIAGAILISIILISIGVMVVNSADSLVDEGTKQMDEQAVNAFNRKFSGYQGTRVRGSNVRTLVQTVNTSNAQNAQNQSEHMVTLTGDDVQSTGSAEAPAYSSVNVASSKYYKVEVTDYYPDGAIKTITISAASGSTGGSGTTGGTTGGTGGTTTP